MTSNALDEAGLPDVLMQAGLYVADKQRELAEARQQNEALLQEKNRLQLDLAVARREKATQVANLQAERASLQTRLGRASSAKELETQLLQSAEQRLAGHRSPAGSRSSQEVAGLRVRVQELEALCAQQAQQLEAVPALRLQLQQQQQESDAARQLGASSALEQKHQQEQLAAALAERDHAKEKCVRYKRQIQEQAQAYRNLKDKLRRLKREHEEALDGSAKREGRRLDPSNQQQQQQQQQRQPCAASLEQVVSLAPPCSVASGEGKQQHLSCTTATQRPPTLSSAEAAVQLSASSGPDCRCLLSLGGSQQTSTRPPAPSAPAQSNGGSAPIQLPAQRASQQHGRLHPQAVAVPPAVVLEAALRGASLPPGGAAAQPTPAAALAGDGADSAVDASDADDDVEVTQAVPPATADPIVVCTQPPPPPPVRHRQHATAVQHQQPGPQRGDEYDAADASGSGGSGPKRQREAALGPAAPGSAPLPSKRRAVVPPAVRDGPLLQQEAQQQQQQQQPAGDSARQPLPEATDAVPLRAAAGLGEGQQAKQQTSGWPSSRPAVPPKQPPQLLGGGWKQAVRDSAASHSAFALELVEPIVRGSRGPGLGSGGRPGSAAVPLREANRGGGAGCPGTASDTGYRYQAVVRKKADREKLQGVECQECKRFYTALESWGTIGQEQVRLECGHVQQAARKPGGAGATNGGASTSGNLNRVQLQQEGSRHRYVWRPPDTQEGFWDMDVTQKQPIRRAQAQQPDEQGEQEQQEQQEQEQQAAESLPVQESTRHPRG